LNIPATDDQPFVVSYNINYENEDFDNDLLDENESRFRIFITTKRLLYLASECRHIHADSTYKLNWNGFPVLIVGTTDMNKCFHPFGLAICTNEKIPDFEFIFRSIQDGLQRLNRLPIRPRALVSDAADAIKTAFSNVFGETDKIMCWAHMKRNIEKRLCHIDDKTIKEELLSDIERLQICSSQEIFDIASSLFLRKWRHKQTNQTVIDFILYFENEWLISNRGWFEGMQTYIPSTNNALEATNRAIKDDGTFRERHCLSRFLVISTKIVQEWSIERDVTMANAKLFAKNTTISLKVWTSAYQWAKQNKNIICVYDDDKKKLIIFHHVI